MELVNKVYNILTRECELGNAAVEEGDFDAALLHFEKALALIPKPKTDWDVATWVYTAIGDTYFIIGNFNEAADALYDAYNCPDGHSNPFVLLRLGQALFELGQMEKAEEYLMRAYMLEGNEIFKDEDQKYLDYLGEKYEL